ncbi:MAG: TonB-dependent receptor [Bacteroidota bacterium]
MKRNFDHLFFLLFTVLLLLTNAASAQTTIKGNVTEESGDPLIGANVIVKGTDDGDVTDLDGNYTVSTSASFPFTLVFSYTGFNTQEIEVTSDAPVNVTLSEGILTEEVVVSASRRREKVQEAPASISVLSARKLESTANSTDATRNLINVAGVQIQQQSANRINISMRGGAGLFGTSAFPILDYRSLVGPGIGTFQSDQAGISNIDLQRIEVVRGAGSALYGPGVTQGVVHFITKNPIDFPGTTVELMAGELNTFGIGARHATKVSDKFGFKVNAQYRRGNEFTLDPNNPEDTAQIAKFSNMVTFPALTETAEGSFINPLGEPRVLIDDLDEDEDGNPMSDEWYNAAFNATLEFRPKDNLSIFTSGGFNTASSVFYNEQGEGLAQANEYWAQARVQAGGLFGQVFVVSNDGGSEDNPTFLYQTGNFSGVARNQLEAQLQYNKDLDFLNSNWTVGADYRLATQDTKSLVYGRNEDDDNYEVIGAYIQGKMELSDKFDFVVAGRYDRFNFIDDGAFAPRAALVYKVNPKHTFRASYNRTNTTVSNLQLNIDFPLSVLAPGLDIWLYGNKTTQTYENTSTTWVIPGGSALQGLDQLPLGYAFSAVNAPVTAQIAAALQADPNTAPLEPLVTSLLNGIDPNSLGFYSEELFGRNIFDNTPLGVIDAPISTISTGDQFEIGYKGLIKNKLGVSLDIYHIIERNNSQFTAISPVYTLPNVDDPNTGLGSELGVAVAASIRDQFIAALVANGQSQAMAEGTYAALEPSLIGAYAAGGAQVAASLADAALIATRPTDQSPDNGFVHIGAGYRTFDERSYTGFDLGLEYYFTNDLSAFFNYSWVDNIEFMQRVVGNEAAGKLPSFLNIPQNKFRLGVNYTPELGIRGSISFQYDEAYVASAGQFSTDDPSTPDVVEKTDPRNLVDASIGYKFDFGLAIDASASNLLNNKFRYLPNMPEIGRRALLKLTYDFGVGGKNN